MFGLRTRECLVDTRLDVAFRLAADGCQFGNHKVSRTFEHTLFTEREGFEIAQIGQMLENIGNFEDVSGTHFF